MNISSHDEYGLRCALQLARHQAQGAVSASKIAELEGLSVEYVSKFMHLLRKAGLVGSERGLRGGFRLKKAASEIALSEIFAAFGSARARSENFCQHFKGQRDLCTHADNCSARPVWSIITSYFSHLLDELTLADLLKPELLVREQVENVFFELLNQSSGERLRKGRSA